MAGNVSEWVNDYYLPGSYADCASGCADPPGPGPTAYRVARGGSYLSDAIWLRLAARSSVIHGAAMWDRGVRCAATP
jgi:formylglycine-generating enzyme required for sulfatase activity